MLPLEGKANPPAEMAMATELPAIRALCAGARPVPGAGASSTSTRDCWGQDARRGSPYVLRASGNTVALVHRGTGVVERSFVFPERVIDAASVEFPPSSSSDAKVLAGSVGEDAKTARGAQYLCVLVRSDCVNIYAPSGDVYEVALPFQANRIFPMTDANGNGTGLLLQRSSVPVLLSTPAKRPAQGNGGATGNSSSYSDHRYVPASAVSASSTTQAGKAGDAASAFAPPLLARPRFFTLSHPLDEVKPIALGAPYNNDDRPKKNTTQDSTRKGLPVFLSDPALTVVSLISELLVLVAFHEDDQRFCVYRLEKISPSRQQRPGRTVPNVEIVDGPAWTAFRQHMEFQEHRIIIEPEWVVYEVWRSPSLANNLASTPAKPAAVSTRMPTNPVRRAFLASHADRSPLLCMVDKRAGMLMLQPISLRGDPSRSTQQVAIAFDEQETPAIVQCSDAVPITLLTRSRATKSLGDQVGARDIVVLQTDGTLVLYRSNHSLCRIELAWDCDVPSADAKPLSLLASEDSESFETVMARSNNRAVGTKAWRWEHPLRFAYSPLVSVVMEVLDYALPPITSGKLRVEVAHRAQAKVLQIDQCTSLSGYEWAACVDCLVELADMDNHDATADVDMNSASTATARHASAFDLLCQSEYHAFYQYEHGVALGILTLPPAMLPPQLPVGVEGVSTLHRPLCDFQEHAASIFAALHLLHEDLKLSQTSSRSRLQLVDVLQRMAGRLGLQHYLEYYRGESCIQRQHAHADADRTRLQARSAARSELCPWLSRDATVPDILQWIQGRVTGANSDDSPFPVISVDTPLTPHVLKRESPLRRTRAVCGVYDLLFPVEQPPDHLDGLGVEGGHHTPAHHWVKAMSFLSHELSQGAFSLDDLPVGVAYPIVDAIRAVKQNPPPFIGEEICTLIGRPDLAGSAVRMAGEPIGSVGSTSHRGHREQPDETTAGANDSQGRDAPDGLDEVVAASQPMFPRDQRVKEVARLLRSSRPICLKLEKGPDTSDQDYVQQQQTRLLLLCKRSMSLSVARGMVTLGNFDVNLVQTQAWQLRVPALPLAGRTPPTNAIVLLDVSGYAKELTYWPQFHNGCATGLRLPATDLSRLINRHWIKYHRPTVSTESNPLQSQRHAARINNRPHLPAAEAKKQNLEEEYAAHAGLLLGIGLRGHLKCLSMADVYNYLSLSNEYVTVAILLGMATTAAYSRQQRVRESKSSSSARSQSEKEAAEATSPIPPPTNDGNDDGLGGADVLQGPADEDLSFLSSRGVAPSTSGKPRALGGMGLELTLERSVSKMLCLHVPSLLPASFAEFSVPASTQTAALLGLGILYQATGYRLMAELLLAEIARSPSSSQFVSNHNSSNTGLSTTSFDQLEGYSLAAGLALGLVLLGRGRETTGDPGLADLNLEERLHKYIVGGSQQQRDANAAGSCLHRGRRWKSFGNVADDGESTATGGNSSRSSSTSAPRAGSHDSKYASSDRAASQAEHVNIGVTAPGSALALAFMYMQSGNKSVASQLAVPDTLILLDYVRPDILLVRTLARNLVLWDDISPTAAWIEERQVPEQLRQSYIRLCRRDRQSITPAQSPEGDDWQEQLPPNADLRSICESYANIVAGACFSMGLRFAGTSNAAARATLRTFVLHFRELRTKSPTSSIALRGGNGNVIAAATERPTIERCLAVCALALAMVDAGTGLVETMTLLRSLNLRQRVDVETTYGSHMALSMALGLLFLGGGRATLSRSKEAIAALVVSLYPMMPLNTADNKYHLQAFRHLYVLAVDTSRHVETVDASSHGSCSVPIRVELKPSMPTSAEALDEPKALDLQSPCLMPELASIRRISIATQQYYPVEITLDEFAVSTELPAGSQGGVTAASRTANALRATLLRERSVIMLKRRKVTADPIDRLGGDGRQRPGLAARSESYDLDDRLVHLLQLYVSCDDAEEACGARHNDDEDDEEDAAAEEPDLSRRHQRWWAPHLRPAQLDWLRDDVQLLLPLHLNSLLALFRLSHGTKHLATTSDLWNLRLLTGIKTHLRDPGRDSTTFSGGDDRVESGAWLQQQIDLALRRLWQRSGLSISSVASARVKLLGDAPASPNCVNAERTFLEQAIVRYFAGSAWRTLAHDWKPRLSLALASRASTDADARELSPFDLCAFLATDASTLSTEEKTFWLRLVSFFLFSA